VIKLILSVSRRTDIPNYYSEWFYNRIKEGYVLVRNPMNIHQVSKIAITPEIVDCIVFWTKNPAPMIGRLDELKGYFYYFQFTVNSYARDIEPNVPSKNEKIIDTFRKLSDKIGREKVIWRYDPILLSDKYSIDYHVEYFCKTAEKLKDYTYKCTISFIDLYRNTTKNVKQLSLHTLTADYKRKIAQDLSQIAMQNNLKIDTCAEDIDLSDLNIGHARCIDDKLIEEIIGCPLNVGKDKAQRLECGCVESIDIGMYNTCLNGCKYCYANLSENTVKKNSKVHDANSPLLCGTLTDEDKRM
jgi:DNA repair photolyase